MSATEITLGDPPVQPAADLMLSREWLVGQLTDHAGLTAERALEITDLLISLGVAVEGVPPARRLYTDAQTFAERTILAELVARLFRFYVLGSIILPDTPAAMDWLKSFLDGTNGQGPLGAGPMLWPRMIPSAVNVLTKLGFEPTPSEPPYVIRRRPG